MAGGIDNVGMVRRTLTDIQRKAQYAELEFYLSMADNLIDHALENREYFGFTGNTQTSYCVGVYLKGRLAYTFTSQEGQEKPIMHKLKYGASLNLIKPYERNYVPKRRYGLVDVDANYGVDSALQTLKNLEKLPVVRNCKVSMAMTTGTEYSETLEKVFNLNVLTNTYIFTKDNVVDSLEHYLKSIVH